MQTLEQLASERATLTARLSEVELDLKDDPKDHGAKRERTALKRALKSNATCARIMTELEATKKLLAECNARVAS